MRNIISFVRPLASHHNDWAIADSVFTAVQLDKFCAVMKIYFTKPKQRDSNETCFNVRSY